MDITPFRLKNTLYPKVFIIDLHLMQESLIIKKIISNHKKATTIDYTEFDFNR